jgi:hypothetical protein
MRYISIILNIIALLFAVVSLLKDGRWVKYIFLVIAATALVITITPLNIIDIPIQNQTTRLMSLLRENNMIADEKIVANENVSLEERIMITSAFNYIRNSQGNRLDVFDGIDNTNFAETFGFQRTFEGSRASRNFGSYRHTYYSIDVEAYSKLYRVSQSGSSLDIEDLGVSYDITKYIEELYELHGLIYDDRIEIDIGDNKLILTQISFTVCENETLSITRFNGYFLLR